MIRQLPSLLLFLVLAAFTPATAQQWVEHRPAGAGYRIEFPGAPAIESEDRHNKAGRPYKLTMASYQPSRNVVFMVSHADWEPTAVDPDLQAELDRARDGGLQNSKGTLLEEKRLTVGDTPARRILADIPQGRTVQLIVLSSSRIYHVIALVPAGWEDGPDIKRFLQSFALVPP
jgi:hypothetical protein